MKKEMNAVVKIDEAMKLGSKTCLVTFKHHKDLIMHNRNKVNYIKDQRIPINKDKTKIHKHRENKTYAK